MDKRFVLVFFVLAAVAVGVVILLIIGSREVERDGVENDGAAPVGHAVTTARHANAPAGPGPAGASEASGISGR